MARVLGVDGCKNGWVGLSNDTRPVGYFAADISTLVDLADQDGSVDVVAVDMPIGLPIDSARQADLLARATIGKLSSSVFPTPVRDALLAETHALAVERSIERTGKGLSVQSYGLRRKILEVDAFVRAVDRTVIEIHPEVSFATLAGRSLTSRKSTWSGIEERRQLLANAGISIPANIGPAGDLAAADDVLDAAVAAWSAVRYSARRAIGYPSLAPDLCDDRVRGRVRLQVTVRQGRDAKSEGQEQHHGFLPIGGSLELYVRSRNRGSEERGACG